MAYALLLDATDNVAVALADLAAGDRVVVRTATGPREIVVRDPIPFGHKLAMVDLPAGTDVRKYGEVIGRATAAIPTGAHVHVQNVRSLRS